MGKEEIIQHVESHESKDTKQQITAGDLDTTPECAYCHSKMPYADFNEHSPSVDYIIHVLPGEDEYTEPDKVLYCSTGCLIQQRESLLGD